MGRSTSVRLFLLLACIVAACEAQSNWYYSNWCGGNLEYLEDKNCVKVFPTNLDRELTCATPVLTTPPAGFQADGELPLMNVDLESLPVTDPFVKACLIVTKRVANSSSPAGVTLYNKYYCNAQGANTPFETWSSSKIFAVANAAGHLRTEETSCAKNAFGIDSSTTGKHGSTLLGDLATIICSYDHTAGYTSNSLSSYFHDLGFRERINTLVHDWLGFPTQSLGGNYGEATPSDLKFQLSNTPASMSHAGTIPRYSKIGQDSTPQLAPAINHTSTQPPHSSSSSSTSSSTQCAADKDPWPTVFVNSLTALSAAELTRRIAMFREIAPELRFPGTTWQDMQYLLYGAEQSGLFPGQAWGGMTADTAVFMQSSPSLLDLLTNDSVNQKGFRIFSKLGAGYSSSRYVGEIVSNAHLCLPSRGEGREGLEVTVSVEGSVPQDYDLSKVEQHVVKAMQQIVDFALSL